MRREVWRRLVGEVLPAAAASHPEWPIRLDHCFARVILDAVFGRPWREAIPAPAWRNISEPDLERAIDLGERVARGDTDLAALNRRSLEARGKRRTA